MVYANDSKSFGGNPLRVQVSPPAQVKNKRKTLVIVGPTASGKSALAVQLARKLGGEVLSADSRQVYTGLNIGTGKITKKEMGGIRHHLLDVVSPKKVFTAHNFIEKGREAIEDIQKRGKLPIICGGTGFYIDALVGRIILPDVPANPKLRTRLEKKPAAQLFALLKKLDPRRAKGIDKHNSVRLVRAIEIAHALGKVPVASTKSLPYSVKWIGIQPDEKKLRTKIHTRLNERMQRGMVQEAKRLHSEGLSYKRMFALGLEYRYLALYLQNKMSKKEMLEKLELDIWHYAKRQITYWQRNRDISWFKPEDLQKIERRVQKLIHA